MAAQAGQDGHVYATLLLSDTYLPGALVLAHSLRDNGTTKKLAVLVTEDTVSVEVISQLRAVFDYVIPVPRLSNAHPNLDLMNRTDLHSAFTKINLWKLTQFSKIVYLDADVIAYRAPDELFDIDAPFSAAPDIGWPDIFNTGVMVLKPDLGVYNALMGMVDRGESFDGADQGLLNMYFKDNYNRISFAYNVTPSGHYQYLPAYRHFQSSINMVHFIGSQKPWFQGRPESTSDSPYDEMIRKWWDVYDKHYGEKERRQASHPRAPELVQYFVKGEFQPVVAQAPLTEQVYESHHEGPPSSRGPEVEKKEEHHRYQPSMEPCWDAQTQPPPRDSRPEAMNFPQTRYEMSRDTKPFVAPETYPEPPKNMWYEVPKEPPPAPEQKPRAIFPWESHQPRPTRVFAGPPSKDEEPPSTYMSGSSVSEPEGANEPFTPTSPTITFTPSDPWAAGAPPNAWDDVPGIHRYVEHFVDVSGIAIRQRGDDGQGLQGALKKQAGFGQRGFFKVTDFPTAEERPSLPVTPAPIGRSRPLVEGGAELPEAEGVPKQADWNPMEQLAKLAKQQAEVLRRKLSEDEGQKREIPQRELPGGSEDVLLPAATVTSSAKVLSPRPVKAGVGTKVMSFAEDDKYAPPEMRKQDPRYSPWHPARRGGGGGHARSGSGGTVTKSNAISPQDSTGSRVSSSSKRGAYGRGSTVPKSHGFPGPELPEPSPMGPELSSKGTSST